MIEKIRNVERVEEKSSYNEGAFLFVRKKLRVTLFSLWLNEKGVFICMRRQSRN